METGWREKKYPSEQNRNSQKDIRIRSFHINLFNEDNRSKHSADDQQAVDKDISTAIEFVAYKTDDSSMAKIWEQEKDFNILLRELLT